MLSHTCRDRRAVTARGLLLHAARAFAPSAIASQFPGLL
jgi:hypothetical protein